MLGDTDRERSADLEPDDSVENPAFTPGDGKPAEPAEQQQRGTVFAVFPEVLAFGRMPKAAHLFVVAAFVANAFNWCATVPFFCAEMAGYTDPSALIWLTSVSFAAGNLCYSVVLGSLRLAVAPGGGLELLGINEVELSDESIKSLKTWRVLLFTTQQVWVVDAFLVFAFPFLMSPETYRRVIDSGQHPDGRIRVSSVGFVFAAHILRRVGTDADALMVSDNEDRGSAHCTQGAASHRCYQTRPADRQHGGLAQKRDPPCTRPARADGPADNGLGPRGGLLYAGQLGVCCRHGVHAARASALSRTGRHDGSPGRHLDCVIIGLSPRVSCYNANCIF